MKNKEIELETLELVYDCLIGIDKIHDEHPDAYNGAIAALICYAREQIEMAIRDIKRIKAKGK